MMAEQTLNGQLPHSARSWGHKAQALNYWSLGNSGTLLQEVVFKQELTGEPGLGQTKAALQAVLVCGAHARLASVSPADRKACAEARN